MGTEFDYVVVGAGSAGCVLANRLSEDPYCSVALIEAGGDKDQRLTPIPGAATRLQNTRSDWSFSTTPQPELFERKIPYPRGRVVGGTSILNYMVYIRGNAGDFDLWAEMGLSGWSYQDVLPYFIKSEANAEFHDEYHGVRGPLSVESPQTAHQYDELFWAAAETMGLKFNPDFNGATQWGYGLFQATLKDGLRCSTDVAFLDPALNRPNVTVFKNTHVLRINFEEHRAVGVECLAAPNSIKKIRAEREVVLSAGSVGSPHLLMLSGVGPADHLGEHGITVVCDQPNVGHNLEDHIGPGSMNAFVIDPDDAFGQVPQTFDEALSEFERSRKGLLASHHLDSGAFFAVDPNQKYPQNQVFFIPSVSEFFRSNGVPARTHFSLGGYPCRMKSRGEVRLASSNPLDPPIIDPKYLSEPDDLRILIEQVKWNRELLNSKPLAKVRRGIAEPKLESDAELEAFVRETSSTIWHPTGTCRMGKPEDGVVDGSLKVHGLEGISICDASIMPTITSGNTNAPTIMIGEKGADLIRARQH